MSVELLNNRRLRTEFRWRFHEQSAGAATIPSGLTFTRASNGHSIQSGTNTLLVNGGAVSLGNNVGRIGKLADAHRTGIFLEPSRTNSILNNRDMGGTGWNTGTSVTLTADAAAGPDGAVSADRNAVLSGGNTKYQNITSLTNGAAYTGSSWQRATSGTSEFRLGLVHSGTAWTYDGGPGQTLDTNWTRRAVTRAITATSVLYIPFDGSSRSSPSSIAAQAADLYLDHHQLERGRYPTSVIGNTSSANARAGERLLANAAQALRASLRGRIGVYMRMRALAAWSEIEGTEGTLLSVGDGAANVFVNPSGGASPGYIYAWDGGSKESRTANNAITWSRYDLLEFAIEWGLGRTDLRWRVNGGAIQTANFSVSDQSLVGLDLTSGLDLAQLVATSHLPCILEEVSLCVPRRNVF